MKNNFYKEMRNLASCKLISKIRLIYQILFYISLICSIFIFLTLTGFLDLFILIFAYICSYTVLIVLRALEYLVNKVFYLEKELISRQIIPPEEVSTPQQNN